MNKLTDSQPRIYSFIYELGKMPDKERKEYLEEILSVRYDFLGMSPVDFAATYPEFKMGEEAREAKNKVEDLKPKKKTKKEKK
jgi:hypothetical protein